MEIEKMWLNWVSNKINIVQTLFPIPNTGNLRPPDSPLRALYNRNTR